MKTEKIFRGIHSETGDVVIGYGVIMCDDIAQIIHHQGINIMHHTVVEPDSVCQFTGFKDNTGTNIFEGDTLQLANDEPYGDIEPNFTGVVQLIEGCFYVNSGYAAHKVWQEIAEWKIIKTY